MGKPNSHILIKKRKATVSSFVVLLTVVGALISLRLGFGLINPHILQVPWTKRPQTSNGIDVDRPSHFSLKHIYHHNTEPGVESNVHARLDLSNSLLWSLSQDPQLEMLSTEYTLKSNRQNITRFAQRDPNVVESYLKFSRVTSGSSTLSLNPVMVREEIVVPDISDNNTVITLAHMAANAYVDVPHTGDWTNVSEPWHEYDGIGWMGDGVRGYVFADDTNSTVVVAIKGTSAAIFDGGGDTGPNDKTNDNLLFSCCCARISYMWNTVCDCYTGESYTCSQTCLEEQLVEEDRYYRAILDIYRNVTSMYPGANIWTTGHSLGGALAALLGRTYGLPVVSFQSPPELLPAQRLHLPLPPGIPVWEEHIWHFGHTADPVYMGACNGAGSSCWIAGYAFETRCHSGLRCVYDVVADKGWHMSMANHRIHVVIDDILTQYNSTPSCVATGPCEDCFDWNFVVPEMPLPDPISSSSITTSLPTSIMTSHSPPSDTDTPKKCVKRTWYGRCYEWDNDDDDYKG